MLERLSPIAGISLLCLALGSGPAHALTVYTAGPGGLIKKLADGFTQESGIKVDIFQADTGKVFARLESEAANPQADVVISASWDSATDLHARGWLLDYASPNAARVPDAYKGPSYVAQGLSALGLVWNTKSGTPRPTDWDDLTQAAYKDKINLPDPAQSGTALELLGGLQAARGDAAWQLLAQLRGNGAAVAGANAQALNPVLQGAKAVVFGAVDYVAYGAQEKGETVEVIFPSSGTVIAPRPMMILKSSQSPDDARKFIDFVLSETGQAMVADTFLLPARTDIRAKRPGLAEIPLLPADPQGPDAAGRAALLQKFSTAFARK